MKKLFLALLTFTTTTGFAQTRLEPDTVKKNRVDKDECEYLFQVAERSIQRHQKMNETLTQMIDLKRAWPATKFGTSLDNFTIDDLYLLSKTSTENIKKTESPD